jgi:hypothetical protein
VIDICLWLVASAISKAASYNIVRQEEESANDPWFKLTLVIQKDRLWISCSFWKVRNPTLVDSSFLPSFSKMIGIALFFATNIVCTSYVSTF